MTQQEGFPRHLSKKGAVSVLWVSGCWRNPHELHPFSYNLNPQMHERKKSLNIPDLIGGIKGKEKSRTKICSESQAPPGKPAQCQEFGRENDQTDFHPHPHSLLAGTLGIQTLQFSFLIISSQRGCKWLWKIKTFRGTSAHTVLPFFAICLTLFCTAAGTTGS